jgi:hypothetical protein
MMGIMKNEYLVERLVLKAAAIATLVLGVSLLFFSAAIIKLFDKEWGQERHFAVYLGTALIGFAISNWLYSQSRNLSAVRPAIIGNLVSLVTASVIDILFLIRQSTSLVIWLILLLHITFVCAFTYCLLNIRRLSKI